MDRYNDYCSAEQTSRALALGAPIKRCANHHNKLCVEINNRFYTRPTTQQVLGWLNDVGFVFTMRDACHVCIEYMKHQETNPSIRVDVVCGNLCFRPLKDDYRILINAAFNFLENLI